MVELEKINNITAICAKLSAQALLEISQQGSDDNPFTLCCPGFIQIMPNNFQDRIKLKLPDGWDLTIMPSQINSENNISFHFYKDENTNRRYN